MKVMVLSPYLPHQRVGHGGGTAVRDLVKWLARSHEVLLVTFQRPGEECCVDDVRALDPTGRLQVAPIAFTDNMARGKRRVVLARSRVLAAGRAALTGYPYYVTKYYSRAISRQIRRLVQDFQPDAIQIEYLQMALYCRDLRKMRESSGAAKPRLVLNSHELGSLPRERRAQIATNPVTRRLALNEAAAWRRLQIEASQWADTTLCVTPGDEERYAAMGGTNLVTVPLGMDLEEVTADWAPTPREQVLFVGSFGHRPNMLAAQFLAEQVWPQVIKARPAAELVLTGRGSDQWLAGWLARHEDDGEGLEATGFVENLAGLFRESRLFVAPLNQGGGIKIKILEAMARGIPVVTT
nr:glycosyltransferase [Candidatus Krumholzibacteria bacterium]